MKTPKQRTVDPVHAMKAYDGTQV